MSSSVQEPSAGSAKRYSWRGAVTGNVLAVGLVSLFTDFSSEMIYPLLPLYLTGLVGVGLAPLYIGLMGGLADTTASILKIFSGRISDKLGKRKALVALGYGISTVARPLMALAGAGWHVVGLRVGDRVGKGIRTAPRDALISDAVGPDARGIAFSFHRIMDHVGSILGPVAAVVILYLLLGRGLWKGTMDKAGPEEMTALRWLFAIALIPGLLAMLAIFGKVKEIAPKKAEVTSGDRDTSAWRKLPRRFYAYTAIVGLFSLGNSSDLFLVLYSKVLFGYGLLQIIALWVALHVSKIVFSFPGGILSDKLGRRPIILAGWSMYALVYLGFALLATQQGGDSLSPAMMQGIFWALILAYGFYYGMSEGVEKAVVADFIPGEHRGTAYGIYHGFEGGAKLPASVLFGVVWVVLNGVRPGLGPIVAFSVGAGLAGAAVVCLTILLSATPRAPQQA